MKVTDEDAEVPDGVDGGSTITDDTDTGDVDAAPVAYAFTHRQVQTVLVGLMAGSFLAALDQTIVATALPKIVGDFGGVDQLAWIASIYLLTSTAAMPVIGKLSDLYGRRLLFQVSIVVFVLGSLMAGLSQSMGQLIAARAVQGFGAGGLVVLNFSVLADIVAPRERGKYQGYVASVWALASVLGPLVGASSSTPCRGGGSSSSTCRSGSARSRSRRRF